MDDLLLAIYQATLDDNGMQRMLELLAAIFACHSAAFVFADRRRTAADIRAAVGPFAVPEVRARYDRDFAALDPAPTAMIGYGVGRASTTDLLFDLSSSEFQPFLQGFYFPIGLGGALGAPLICNDNVVSLVAVHRRIDREPFSDADVAIFERLVPHLTQMAELRHTFFTLQSDARSLEAVLDGQSAAVLIVDTGGVVHHGNAAARKLLALADAFALDPSGRLRVVAAKARQAVETAISSGAASPKIVKVPRPDRVAPYVVSVQAAPGLKNRLTVRVCDPAAASFVQSAALGEILGLTGAGAKLVAALANGSDLKTYAHLAGITLNTARFHLKSAFAATGTRRQAELVRFVNAIQRDLAL